MSFLFPAAVAALLALAVPLLLHLERRRQRPQLQPFSALRWLPTPQRPRRRVQLREPWLLLLRCLLIAAVVTALAQPQLDGPRATLPWHVVVPGVDLTRIEWPDHAHERRWLAPGFPPLGGVDEPQQPAAVASLLRELDAMLPAASALVVHVPAILSGLDGERPALSRAVDWRIAAASPSRRRDAAPLRIAVADFTSSSDGMRFVAAARDAWQLAGTAIQLEPFDPDTPPPADTDTVLWPASRPPSAVLSAWLEAGGRVLGFAARAELDDDGAVIAWHGRGGARLHRTRIGHGELRLIDCPLEPACLPELLDADFPQWLHDWLAPMPTAPDRAEAADIAARVVERTLPEPTTPLAPWFALLAALLFVIERWLANRRRAAHGTSR